MIRRQILGALLVVVSLALTIPCVAQQSQIEKEIRDLEDKMNAAYAANDLPVYFAYYADDFTQWVSRANLFLTASREFL
jgi:ketosteroid isomerase-like protein